MNRLSVLSLLAATALSAAAASSAPKPSSGEVRLVQARAAVAEKPDDAGSYNLLAMAFISRAQETSDNRYYDEAAGAAQHALTISPGNFEARKIAALALLGKHDFPAALTEAQVLNKKVPDDVMLYGVLTDAYSGIGDYAEAEKSAQWMLNLRPGNLPAFIHAAHLREAFGDMNGSYDALNLAYQGTSPTESTDRAALLINMARERRLAGVNDAAEKLAGQALDIFPGYSLATEELADVYLAEKRYPEAIQLLRQRCQALPTAQNLYRLATALELSGHLDEAATTFDDFAAKAVPESAQKDNSNLELVFYYAGRAHQPSKALAVAEREHAWRHDIYTLDAYAWALHVNGRDQEARQQLDIALAVGTRDPAILAHSSQIPVHAVTTASAR